MLGFQKKKDANTLSGESNTKKAAPARINALKGGSYSFIITVIVLGILVAVNVLACALPTTATQFDISSSKLYSITSNTKVVVNNLDQDVTIYWICQTDEEDRVVENLLGKYESLSDYITVVKKNPDVYPTFAEQYTDEQVYNNSLIVECGERSKYISYSDIYLTEADVTTYSYTTSFDGEGALTSAIDYVTTEEHPVLYMTEGHGETELPSTFADQLDKENIEVKSFTLVNSDEIPEDADAVLIYAPESDFSEEEVTMLEDYAESGGKLMVCAGPTEEGYAETLYELLGDYGVETCEGIVCDGDREHYAYQANYILMPDMTEDDVTSSLIEENYYPLVPVAQGLTLTGTSIHADATVTELLTTTEEAYSKVAGYALTTYEKEEGDIDGPFSVALSVDTSAGGTIYWISSSWFLDDTYNAYASGANVDLGMNCITALVGETEAMSIRSKSLNYSYLTISESAASLLKTIMIGVLPVVYLGIGIVVTIRRRRLQNEAI